MTRVLPKRLKLVRFAFNLWSMHLCFSFMFALWTLCELFLTVTWTSSHCRAHWTSVEGCSILGPVTTETLHTNCQFFFRLTDFCAVNTWIENVPSLKATLQSQLFSVDLCLITCLPRIFCSHAYCVFLCPRCGVQALKKHVVLPFTCNFLILFLYVGW